MLESASQCNRRVGKITPSRQAALVLICLLTLSATAAADSSVKKQQGKTTLRLAQASEPQVSPAAPAPSYPPSVNTSILRQGTQLIDAGKQQEALTLFQNYCRNKPQDASGYFWTGVCFDEMDNYASAVQAYRQAVFQAEQSSMDSSEIRTNLGNDLLKQNELDQAIESYKKALQINPLYGLAQLNLGRAFIAKNDFPAALAAFDRCDELHVSARQLAYYRAKALTGAGRKDEAQALIQRLLQGLPAGEARKALEQEFQTAQPPQK